jgi:transcriptional regulator with XRE-family HTH domain
MTLREVARRAEVNVAHLSRVELGQRNLSTSALLRVVHVLGLREFERMLAPYVIPENDHHNDARAEADPGADRRRRLAGRGDPPVSPCGRCGAGIRWVRTAKNDRPMPLDAEPTPGGTVILRAQDSRAVVLDIPDRDLALQRGETVWRPHFASCGAGRRRS